LENLASPSLGLIVGFVTGASLSAVAILILVALSGKTWGRPRATASRLALKALLLLDEFAVACHAAAFDTPEFDEDDPDLFFMHTDEPSLTFPDTFEWSILGSEIENELARMPNAALNVSRALEHLQTVSQADEDFFGTRRAEYVKLGIAAFDLADRIENKFSLSTLERPDFFRPRQDLLREQRKRQSALAGKENTLTAQASSPSNVTSIFAARPVKIPEI